MKLYRLVASVVTALVLSAPAHSAPLDINTADAESLARVIDGVGEKKSLAIVRYRETHGPFGSIDDLAQIKGISSGTVERNRSQLTVIMPKER
jgi:competence protein ComEA